MHTVFKVSVGAGQEDGLCGSGSLISGSGPDGKKGGDLTLKQVCNYSTELGF